MVDAMQKPRFKMTHDMIPDTILVYFAQMRLELEIVAKAPLFKIP